MDRPTADPDLSSATGIRADTLRNASDLAALVASKKASGAYLTTVANDPPWAPWAEYPSPVNPRSELENRPCHRSVSRVHELVCGHFVLTPYAAQCAGNCAGAREHAGKAAVAMAVALCSPAGQRTPEEEAPDDNDDVKAPGPDFGCRLCVRAALAVEMGLLADGGLKRQSGMMLEQYTDEAREMVRLAGFRACEVVFVSRDGTIIPVREKIDAAVARAIELVEESSAGREGRGGYLATGKGSGSGFGAGGGVGKGKGKMAAGLRSGVPDTEMGDIDATSAEGGSGFDFRNVPTAPRAMRGPNGGSTKTRATAVRRQKRRERDGTARGGAKVPGGPKAEGWKNAKNSLDTKDTKTGSGLQINLHKTTAGTGVMRADKQRKSRRKKENQKAAKALQDALEKMTL
ncbi:hypothetical protein K432DRAFT_396979 [Lepidopterella palustris CBS 459.81]|uniref:Uncharacterized protein n=1 Tax=Lepidopterella palustris CBS 459.81 TaxID=1314670 RepID=A0A8E2E1P4_9PEZI|nr:hypothetical protein K432DRAFT_396979 [Lepidopterella palustris CBS 459.81]